MRLRNSLMSPCLACAGEAKWIVEGYRLRHKGTVRAATCCQVLGGCHVMPMARWHFIKERFPYGRLHVFPQKQVDLKGVEFPVTVTSALRRYVVIENGHSRRVLQEAFS